MIKYITSSFENTALTTVLVVEDESHVHDFFAASVSPCEELSLLARVGTVAAAKSWPNRTSHTVDVLLVDLGLPDGSGLEAIRYVTACNPVCEPLVISMFGDEANVLASIESGALGYIHKDSDSQFGTHMNRTDTIRERCHAIAGLRATHRIKSHREAP